MAVKSSSRRAVAITKSPIRNKTAGPEDDVARDLRLLRAILDVSKGSTIATTTTRKPKTPLTAAPRRNAKPAKQGRPADKNGKHGEDEDKTESPPAVSSPVEQKKLAMNCFNKNLKILSVVAKKKQAKQSNGPSEKVASSTTITKQDDEIGPEHVKNDGQNILGSADCASAALAVLRLHDGQETTSDDSTYKREQGAILLLDKMITLDLRNCAYTEASRVREQYCKRQKTAQSRQPSKPVLGTVEMAVLLSDNPKPGDMKDFDMLASLQSQLLRLAILHGPCIANKEFVSAVKVTTKGSPANVIIAAQKNDYVSMLAAGRALRTISQALSKLHASIMKQPADMGTTQQLLALDLLSEAQIIKISSWQMLDHKPNLDHELWTPVERGIKMCWSKQAQNHQTRYKHTKSLIENLQSALQSYSMNIQLPPRLSQLMARLAESNGDRQTALAYLRELRVNTIGIETLGYLCRLATLQLQGDDAGVDSVHLLEDLAQVCVEIMTLDTKLDANDLASIVRLRKACFDRLALISSTDSEEPQQQVGRACLQAMSNVLRLCSFFSQHDRSDEHLQQSTRLSALKTVEAILDLEKHVMSAHDPVIHEYLTALESCITFMSEYEAQILQSGNQRSVLNAFKLRISNVYWRAHLRPGQAQDSPYTAIELAKISVSCIEGLSVEELSNAALGPRLEKLSALCKQAEDVERALRYNERAVKHYVSAGALVDAVEASLSKSRNKIWEDNTSLAGQLGRALHSYNATALDVFGSTSSPACIYDDESLPAMHRAVLLEHQILYMLRKYPQQSTLEAGLEYFRKVIEFTDLPQYHMWILRFAYVFVFRASKVAEPGMDSMLVLVNEIDKILEAEILDPSVFLASYHATFRTLLTLQCALLKEPSATSETRATLDTLRHAIESCVSAEDFESTIDDLDILLHVLNAYTDQVLAIHHYETAAICLKIRVDLEERYIHHGGDVLISCYNRLTLCHVRLDDIDQADTVLGNVRKLRGTTDCEFEQTLNFHLVSAEYHLATSSLDQCKSSLQQAGLAFAKLWPKDTVLDSSKQIERDSTIAKTALLASELASRYGNSLLANQYARQATKISISIWSALEKRVARPGTASPEDSTVLSLTQEMSKLDVNFRPRSVNFQSIGARYWPYLDMHIRTIQHLASILLHMGLCEDALHYFKQLKKLTSSIVTPQSSLSPAPALALLFAKAGKAKEAAEMIEDCASLFNDIESKYGFANAILSACEAHIAQGNLLCAKSLLQRFPAPETVGIAERVHPKPDTQEVRPKSQARRGVAVKRNVKGDPKRQKSVSRPKATKTPRIAAEPVSTKNISFNQLIYEDRRNAILHTCKTSSATSVAVSDDEACLTTLPNSVDNLVQELFAKTKVLLSEAWHELSHDALSSVVTESAVALPSKASDAHRKPRVSFLQGGGDSDNINTSLSSAGSSTSGAQSVAQKLQAALELCNLLLGERLRHCSTDMIQSLVRMEARISLLLASMNMPFVVSSTDLVLKASQPKDCALERERIASIAEHATQDRSALSTWPSTFSSTVASEASIAASRLNDIPSSWSIISMALTEDSDELLLSKTVAGKDPFLVRIPLHRSNDGECIDEFLFEGAKAEMRMIIETANNSSHDHRGTSDKATRAQWHSDREKLDRKLASLLENIEFIWLGGFRGILSPFIFETEIVQQFGQSLTASLEKNLPSRQKSSNAEERVEIHEHILEIFLGLGNPNDNDLDDSIMDLLYFVVDILQFNGERNAYDEIDWDAILIDVLDALRASHETRSTQNPQHTILILDKELELFPWEALPCLINHPVSRMPSLGSIFDRLSQMRALHPNKETTNYTIPKSTHSGAYILNPSGDLKTTQSLFEPILASNLPPTKYTSIINKPPSESQMSSLLQNSDILLYIGHGSGAQYIRPRTIRALPSCAVTFLFGCSSAKMTEHGVYESTGMPKAYMLGHAPAVVGCLWDVTDREIDRVALRTLVSWGLVDGDDERVKEGLRRKGRKGKERSGGGAGDVESGGGKTLVEAVRDGREACVLRYLCGAAVVVYGIPVVLE